MEFYITRKEERLRLTSPNIQRSARAGHFDQEAGLVALADAARVARRFAVLELAFESLDRVPLATPLSHFALYFLDH